MAYTADYLESISDARSLDTFQVPLNTYDYPVMSRLNDQGVIPNTFLYNTSFFLVKIILRQIH